MPNGAGNGSSVGRSSGADGRSLGLGQRRTDALGEEGRTAAGGGGGAAHQSRHVGDQHDHVEPRRAADEGHRLGRLVEAGRLQDAQADVEEQAAGLLQRGGVVPHPGGNAQLERQVSRRGVDRAELGQPAQDGGSEALGSACDHAVSVPNCCNRVVDRSWAGNLHTVPRTIWKGALSFGLVNIPVGLYPATSDKSVHFNQFEEGTSDRIRYKKVNERTGEEVPGDRIVKGFDLGGGEYVILTDEELESAEPKKSRQIEISDFVEQTDIDPVYFRASYYLAPEGEGADKAYALLRKAMADSGRIAIATLVMRNKEYLVAVRPDDDALALHTMYFSDEVRQPGREFPALPNTDEVSDRELSMAQLLIESMESDWDPKRFHDTHREKVEEIIEEKRSGHEIVLQAEPEQPAKVVDLMEALNASIKASARSGAAKPARKSAAKRTPAKATKKAPAAKKTASAKPAARRKAS